MENNEELDLELEFGTPDYDNSNRNAREYVKQHSLQSPAPGEMASVYVARIVPPLKSQKKSGKYMKWAAQHFGTRRLSKRTGKLYAATYLCLEIKDFNSKTVIRECPKCVDIQTKKEDLEKAKHGWKVAGKTDEEIKQLSRPLNEWLKKHNRDAKNYLNVMTQDGDFQLLRVTKRCKEALELKISELRKSGVEPLDPKAGVWFKFMRQGQGKDVVDSVDVVKEFHQVPGIGKAEVIKPAPMTKEQMKKALEICPDLDPEKGEIVRKLTQEQILALVQGSEDPQFVETVFNKSFAVPNDDEDTDDESEDDNTSSASGELPENFWDKFKKE